MIQEGSRQVCGHSYPHHKEKETKELIPLHWLITKTGYLWEITKPVQFSKHIFKKKKQSKTSHLID
mgnify:CR=1 FL=1